MIRLTPACGGAREQVFTVIQVLRRAPAHRIVRPTDVESMIPREELLDDAMFWL